jgi:hypothetical protein
LWLVAAAFAGASTVLSAAQEKAQTTPMTAAEKCHRDADRFRGATAEPAVFLAQSSTDALTPQRKNPEKRKAAEAQDKKVSDPESKLQQKLDRDSFRLKVDPILQGNQDMAIYRIQVWTIAEPEDSEIGYGGMVGRSGLFQREKDSQLFRSDFLVVVLFRAPEEVMKGDGKAQLELRFFTVGGRGTTHIIDDVPGTTQLDRVLDIRASDAIHKLRSKQSFGRYQGKVLDVLIR